MSAEEKDEDMKQAQDFLNSFVERSAVYTDVENVPKQSFSMHCSKEEIQGECLHIALEYLRERYSKIYVENKLSNIKITIVLYTTWNNCN